MRHKNKTKSVPVLKIIMFIILFAIILLEIIRLVSPRHLDDVHPNIPCDETLLKKADILYVIPKFENVSIANNVEWCAKILSYNKTLAMHGVYHTYNEFIADRNESYVQDGAEEFNKCFGYSPTMFKPPQVAISKYNKDLLKNKYTLDTWVTERFHKVYHCNNQGMFPNWVSDLI